MESKIIKKLYKSGVTFLYTGTNKIDSIDATINELTVNSDGTANIVYGGNIDQIVPLNDIEVTTDWVTIAHQVTERAKAKGLGVKTCLEILLALNEDSKELVKFYTDFMIETKGRCDRKYNT